MKVKLKENKLKSDIEVLIEYPEMSQTVQKIETAVKSVDQMIRCRDEEDNIRFVRVSDVYYIESVEKQSFVYTENRVFRAEQQLYRYAETLYSFGFEQVGKSCVLNLNVMESVKPIFNSRMEATLTNGEKVHISRKFISAVKRRLEKML